MNEMLTVLFLAFAQNASFTLVSRARNSDSIIYHGTASVFSNLLWLIVFRKLATNLENTSVMGAYLVGTVSGSITMHYVAMKFFEKKG